MTLSTTALAAAPGPFNNMVDRFNIAIQSLTGQGGSRTRMGLPWLDFSSIGDAVDAGEALAPDLAKALGLG